MNCPKCLSPMEAVTHAGITVDRCTACGGLWFDGVEHLDLKKIKGSAVLDTGSEKTGKAINALTNAPCPVCRTVMEVKFDPYQHHIHYERCPQSHGVYFDAGEFRDFVTDDWSDFFKGLFAPLPKN